MNNKIFTIAFILGSSVFANDEMMQKKIDLILENQISIMDNQKIIIQNQEKLNEIRENQSIILKNQKNIISNQEK